MSEERLGQLTGWVRRRPSSLEFWELFVTSDRLIWCFVGEKFSSALLRADMGERARDELDRRNQLTTEQRATEDALRDREEQRRRTPRTRDAREQEIDQ